MDTRSEASLREALTFDDVLLKPGLSELMPSDADIRTRITREIPLNIPIIASAMDTVTEVKMAIAIPTMPRVLPRREVAGCDRPFSARMNRAPETR